MRGRPLHEIQSVATAGIALAAEDGRKSAVLPHCIQKSYKYGRAASAEYAFYAVAAATCRHKQKYKYPQTAVGTAAAFRKDVHMFLLEFLAAGRYVK